MKAVKAVLLIIGILFGCLLGGCTASLLYRTITQPARQITITKVAAPYTIKMDNYTLFLVTFQTASDNTWWELWRSDGTSDGTRLLKKGLTEGNDPIFTAFVRQGSLLLFAANGAEYNGDTQLGMKLWQTDGTAEGTTIVQSVTERPFEPENVVSTQNRIYFNTYEFVNAEFRCSLWSGAGATVATFSVQRISTRISKRPCAGRNTHVQELPPDCIQWKPGAPGDESAFTIESCNDDGGAYHRDGVIVRVNADHTATIEQHSAAKIMEIRTYRKVVAQEPPNPPFQPTASRARSYAF